METAKYIAKALLAGGIAFVGAVATGYSDGAMEVAEWWSAIAAGLVSLGIVFGVPNTEKTIS